MALFAVAGLMRYRVAYSVVEVSRSPSERSPERIWVRTSSAIWR